MGVLRLIVSDSERFVVSVGTFVVIVVAVVVVVAAPAALAAPACPSPTLRFLDTVRLFRGQRAVVSIENTRQAGASQIPPRPRPPSAVRLPPFANPFRADILMGTLIPYSTARGAKHPSIDQKTRLDRGRKSS